MRKTSRAPNEATVYISEDIAEGRVSGTVTNSSHLSHQSHVKSLTGIPNKEFETMHVLYAMYSHGVMTLINLLPDDNEMLFS